MLQLSYTNIVRAVNIRVQRARLWVTPGRGFLVKAVQVKSALYVDLTKSN
jgi:hypothetical protein